MQTGIECLDKCNRGFGGGGSGRGGDVKELVQVTELKLQKHRNSNDRERVLCRDIRFLKA
jgi:hypothetical protein